ncbi:MAG: hypothetical protein ACOC93_02475 [Planctomycetota bacterium]
MADFPRTDVGGLSVSRLIVGTNWFLGYTHTTKAQDRWVERQQTRRRMAEILEVFFRAGVDTVMGPFELSAKLRSAVKDAEDRTGRKALIVSTPHLEIAPGQAARDETARILDRQAAIGADICMPHQASTDALVDRRTRQITDMDRYCRMIREREMIPGLSTHMPETIAYADETGLDVETYIQLYNARGFLMQLEVDWIHRMIWQAKRPVMTIKPLAAGRLHPLVGLAYSWATLREKDMVTIGTVTPDEAREVIDISLAQLAHGGRPSVELQRTRSKESVEGLDGDKVPDSAKYLAKGKGNQPAPAE